MTAAGVLISTATKAMVQFKHSRWMVAAFIAAAIALAPAPNSWAQEKAADPFSEVKTLIGEHRYAEAKTAALDQLKQHPNNVEGYNLLGIVESNQGDYSGAVSSFDKALKISPTSSKTLNNLGNVYVAQKNMAAAEKEFRAVLRIEPSNAGANYNLGLLLMMKNAPAEAIPHFQRVRPVTPASQFNLVRAYFQLHRNPDALRTARELSAASGKDVEVHFSLGTLLAGEKEFKAAQLEFEKADALKPETFEILYNLGQTQLRGGEAARAEVTLKRALRLRAESVDTLYLLAQADNSQSRPLDALDLLVRAHKLSPQNADVIFLMAQVSMSQNYYEDAIPLLESGVAIAPQRADLLAALGESYFMAGKVEKAIEDFKRLVEVDPSARSFAFLGLSYRNLGRFDEARQYFDRGLKLDPRNSLCLFNLGFIAERQGDAVTAEKHFEQALQVNPDFPDALLELANLRTAEKKLPEAEELLRRFVRVAHDPATGYYKLSMVERSRHETEAADRDLNSFKTLSKSAPAGPLPYEHLFDYLDSRSQLAPRAQQQLDLADLTEQLKKHPDQPEDLYMLTEAYLKAGKVDEAHSTIEQLDKISGSDYRTQTGTGVLLARYGLYDDAIRHFQSALVINPASDEIKFNLANAYFKKHQYAQALETAQQVSETGRKDDAYLALLGDIYAHTGDAEHAAQIFRDAITRNPDNDQAYLSLALIQLRGGDLEGAQQTLAKAQLRMPGSGKIYWGLGLVSALLGNSSEAASQLERAIDLLPEWSGGYSTLGVFYFQIGQLDKAREVLNRFKESSAKSSLEINGIERVLDQAAAAPPPSTGELSAANKQQLLQLALSLADRTL